MRRCAAFLLLLCLLPRAEARLFSRSHRRSASLTLRRRLFTSPLITDPGNVDLEYSGAFDTNTSWTLPGTLKYRPYGWNTELSAGFDTLASVVDDSAQRTTHFSDHLNLAATTAVPITERFHVAFAPTLSFFLRGESGARIGGAVFTRYDRAGNTFSTATTWSAATTASDNNPAGTLDFNTGYGRMITKNFTAYANVQWERSSGLAGQYALFEGVEYQFTPRFAVDVSGQHYALNATTPDHQIVLGVTYTLRQHR